MVFNGMFKATRYVTLRKLSGDTQSSYPSNWDKIRKQVLARDNFRCRTCGIRLEVHHVVPLSKGGTNDPDNLITLCSKCHRAIHQAQKFEGKKPITVMVRRRVDPLYERTKRWVSFMFNLWLMSLYIDYVKSKMH